VSRRRLAGTRARRRPVAFARALVALVAAAAPAASAEVPELAAILGFDPRAAGAVVDPGQVQSCLSALAAASPRLRLEIAGLSTEGRPILASVISAPENLVGLEDLRAKREKTFALVTAGVHPTEVASTPSALYLIHGLLTGSVPGGEGLLREVVTCVLPALNPDGAERVARRLRGPTGAGRPPFLEHPYAGHDLNRDWALAGQAEVLAAVRGAHQRFHPWLTVDLHQMSGLGPRIFIPPYAEPLEPSLPADLLLHAERLGDRVLARLVATGRRGAARRWTYDAWSPARAYPFYHGSIRFLIEVAAGRLAGNLEVAPGAIRVFGGGNAATADHPAPWTGGSWGLPEATDYLTFAAGEALGALVEEPMRSGRAARPAAAGEWIRLRAAGADPGATAALLAGLSRSGVEARRDGDGWLVRDGPGTRGWCRALLLCTRYPRSAADVPPYDTASHDLACMAGLEARPAGAAPEIAGEASDADPERAGEWLTPGRLEAGDGEEEAPTWVVGARPLALFAELPELIEAGARVERLAAAVEVRGLRFAPGDLVIAGAPAPWIRRLVAGGGDAAAAGEGPGAGLAGATRPLVFPLLHTLAPPDAPARDEGWLRWVLEEHGFRFASVPAPAGVAAAGAFAPPSRFAGGAPPRGRILVIAEGVLARAGEETGTTLRALVAEGGRVIALGKAAREVAALARLPVVERRQVFLPGTVLPTRVAAERGAGDPLLWGYARPPRVLYTEGPLWEVPAPPGEGAAAGPRVEPILLAGLDPDGACGLLAREDEAAVRGRAVLLRVREGERGGEWILCGFSPHYRSWTSGTFRLLFNAILAPLGG
jgi:hypothetical protein